jgi:hypothetical protein
MTRIRTTCFLPSASIMIFTILFSACQTHEPNQNGKNSESGINKRGPVIPSDTMPEYRKKTLKEPDPLKNWYFSVRIYQTSKTFDYLLKLQFEEIKGEDTIRFPNFGSEPKPVLVKGKDKYACVVGFLDKENTIKEYKLVTVKEGRVLKLTTLHHYTVTTYLDEK